MILTWSIIQLPPARTPLRAEPVGFLIEYVGLSRANARPRGPILAGGEPFKSAFVYGTLPHSGKKKPGRASAARQNNKAGKASVRAVDGLMLNS